MLIQWRFAHCLSVYPDPECQEGRSDEDGVPSVADILEAFVSVSCCRRTTEPYNQCFELEQLSVIVGPQLGERSAALS